MKNNLLIIISALFVCSSAQAISILPDRIITPMLDIFSSRNRPTPDGKMNVMVTTFSAQKKTARDHRDKDADGNEYDDDYKIQSDDGNLKQYGSQKVLDMETYTHFKKLASAVYRMIPRTFPSSTGASETIYLGTAFHIGNNLVLTNVHVLDRTFSNLTECGNFQLKSATLSTTFSCKKVHFCNVENDICLIEMETNKKFFCRGNDCETSSLAKGESLKLNINYRPTPADSEYTDESVLTAIGNTWGLGIHLSQGRGFVSDGSKTYFFAPIRGGNSGGPLLNSLGQVIGVVRQESARKVGSDINQTYNVATTSKKTIQLIREALANDPDTLGKFNQSVIE